MTLFRWEGFAEMTIYDYGGEGSGLKSQTKIMTSFMDGPFMKKYSLRI